MVSHVTHFSKFYPSHIFVIDEARHFKFRVLVDTEEHECMHDILLPKGICSESCDLFKFWEIPVKFDYNTHIFDHYYPSQRGGAYYRHELISNRKSYVAYRMAPLPIHLNDLEGHFCGLKPNNSHSTNLLT